jgi:NAD(P)-dependent dehydrogenase (short-subunit alcohol dehydrogenase family)
MTSDPTASDQPVAAVIGGGWREPGSIGGAICRELAARGLRVAVVELDRDSAELTAGFIARAGGVAEVVLADVTTQAGCLSVLDAVQASFGRLDVLVNNIGIGSGGTVVEASEQDWDVVMDTNIKAAALMCKLAIPRMPPGSAIVNISSISALTPGEHATYTVTKAAVEGLTRALALYHGRAGIRANAVRVGEVATWRVLKGLDDDEVEQLRARRRARSVLGTQGDSWDIARAVAFLAGPDARWITGQILTVDGGAALKRGELWESGVDRPGVTSRSSLA